MFYQPKLANGKLVQNPLSLRVFRGLNHISWPLEDNVSLLARIFNRLYYIFGLLLFLEHYDAEFRYCFRNFQNLDKLLSAAPTTIILIEISLRGFQMGLFKERLKKLLKEFYANIYIDSKENPKIFQSIRAKLLPTDLVLAFYFSTFFLHAIKPIINFNYNIREPLYKMIFFFDISSDFVFYTIIFTNLWVGFFVVSYVCGELNMVAQIILHLNGRFIIMQEDLQRCSRKLLAEANQANIAKEFQLELNDTIKRNVELYKFAAKVQAEFSYRFFVWFALSAILLCTLSFKAYTSPKESASYVLWSVAKIIELCSVGELGSTLIKSTNEVSSMYYHSSWELIIERSTNTYENVRLMKLILVAMETCHKPIHFTGLKFFNISLPAVITILQGAGSYFTCLIALR